MTPEPWGMRFLCGLTGLLAGGLVVLCLALLGAYFLAERLGVPGPEPATIIGHAVAAVVAVTAQVWVDRSRGRHAAVAALVVLLLTVVVLGARWLA